MGSLVRMYAMIIAEEILASLIPCIISTSHFNQSGMIMIVLGIVYILGFTIANHLNPALTNLRSEFKKNTKTFDKIMIPLHFIILGSMLLVIGFDVKGQTPCNCLIITGICMRLLGYFIKLWALKENRFLATTVCIQKEHKVIDSGPYSVIRHPFYLANILIVSGLPLIYGSVIGLLGSLLLIVHKLARISMEEGTLVSELAGYTEYTRRVKSRLIPYLI